ncbi:MAG: helix-turn-helix domain-containing protein [Planctomycetota bacterium]
MHADPNPDKTRGSLPAAEPVIVSAAPLLVGVPEAGRMLGLSVKSIRRMIAGGELPSVMVGSRRLLAVADLTAWAATLPREGGTRDTTTPTAVGGGG